MTITGTALDGATAVDFGPNNPGTIVSDSPTQLVADSPAGSAATVDITVTTPYGTSATSSADQFTYVGVPSITAVGPEHRFGLRRRPGDDHRHGPAHRHGSRFRLEPGNDRQQHRQPGR